jgi:hypothetical protein
VKSVNADKGDHGWPFPQTAWHVVRVSLRCRPTTPACAKRFNTSDDFDQTGKFHNRFVGAKRLIPGKVN